MIWKTAASFLPSSLLSSFLSRSIRLKNDFLRAARRLFCFPFVCVCVRVRVVRSGDGLMNGMENEDTTGIDNPLLLSSSSFDAVLKPYVEWTRPHRKAVDRWIDGLIYDRNDMNGIRELRCCTVLSYLFYFLSSYQTTTTRGEERRRRISYFLVWGRDRTIFLLRRWNKDVTRPHWWSPSTICVVVASWKKRRRWQQRQSIHPSK